MDQMPAGSELVALLAFFLALVYLVCETVVKYKKVKLDPRSTAATTLTIMLQLVGKLLKYIMYEIREVRKANLAAGINLLLVVICLLCGVIMAVIEFGRMAVDHAHLWAGLGVLLLFVILALIVLIKSVWEISGRTRGV